MKKALVGLFEEGISIRYIWNHLELLPPKEKRGLMENAERERKIGLKYSPLLEKVFYCFFHMSHIFEEKAVFIIMIEMLLESIIMDRINCSRECHRCYIKEEDGVIDCICHDITTLYRDTDKDSYIHQREEYYFRHIRKGKVIFPPYLFSEDWLEYGTVVEEVIENYKTHRRERYGRFFLFLFTLTILIILIPKNFHLILWHDLLDSIKFQILLLFDILEFLLKLFIT